MQLEVDVQFLLVMFADQSSLYGNVTISIDELNVKQHFANVELPRTETELTPKTFFLNFKSVSRLIIAELNLLKKLFCYQFFRIYAV